MAATRRLLPSGMAWPACLQGAAGGQPIHRAHALLTPADKLVTRELQFGFKDFGCLFNGENFTFPGELLFLFNGGSRN